MLFTAHREGCGHQTGVGLVVRGQGHECRLLPVSEALIRCVCVRVLLSLGHGLSDGCLVRPQPHCHQLHHHGEYEDSRGMMRGDPLCLLLV